MGRGTGRQFATAQRKQTVKYTCPINIFLNANFAVVRGLEVEFVRRYGDILPLICHLAKMN